MDGVAAAANPLVASGDDEMAVDSSSPDSAGERTDDNKEINDPHGSAGEELSLVDAEDAPPCSKTP